jgi:hypothetical protein
MWILKKLFEMLARFFGTKAGKTTAKVMMGVGAAGGGAAGAEMIVAHKRNKRAERIKESALKRHDKGRIKVEKTLADLGETKLEIYKSFGDLADAVESIQQRPDYDFSVDGIELPEFNPAEFKKIAIAVEVAAGGFGGVVAGGAVGAAAMGTGTILALAPGALLGGVVLCAMGAKMLHRSAEKVKMAKKIAEDVDAILVYYSELDKTAKRFHETFKKVQAPYMQHVHKVQKIVARKTDWEKFSKAERLALKNAVALAQLLHRMCSVQLVLEATKKDTLESVNTPVVDRMISDANNVFEQVKKGLCA